MSKKLVYITALLALVFGLVYRRYYTFDYVQVDIDKGTLRGFRSVTWQGAEFFAFKGIPYAKAPVGDLRFKGPVEEASWTGVRDAIWHGSVCPHQDMATKILWGREDCLFLNVYTPTLKGGEPLPVMFWIHGGAFAMGSGNDDIYGPDYFMDAGNVVLVTINYRLGALGFLSTGDDSAPGNAGLKDQVAALRWVQRNVAKFGGDPDDVTIFGESAGGVSSHYHLLSPMSKGLFSKVISQSGSALMMWALSDDPVTFTERLAGALAAEDVAGDATRALDILKAAPYEDIVRMQGSIVTPEEDRIRMFYVFVPSVEKNVKSEEVFLPDLPLKILESGNFTKVPHMTGYNSHEGYFMYRKSILPETMTAATEDTERYVPYDINDENLRNEVAESIQELYFDRKPVAIENMMNLVDLDSDTGFTIGTNRATKLQLRSSDTPVYFYVFSYSGGLNFLKFVFGINLPGAAHGDDLGYLFYQNLFFWRKPAPGSEDEDVILTMIRLWTNFAKYGNPTPPGDPLTWRPARIGEFNYLNISGRDIHLAENPDPKRADFWAGVYEKNAALT